jgi:hypothetical protein
MLNLIREIEETNQIMKSQQEQYTPQFFDEIDTKIKGHFDQIMNHLNRKEEELQSQSVDTTWWMRVLFIMSKQSPH